MKSFRLQFIDIDESITINTTPSAIRGFMVCRAPKGTTEASLFPYGSEKSINAMIGLQTANWPDIYEAIQFNSEYDLYISAPPGTSEEYPSYYGGVYFTKYGLYEFWHVDDKDNPNYEVQIYPAFEGGDFNSNYLDSKLAVAKINEKAGKQGLIQITNVDSRVIARTSYVTIDCWKDSGTKIDEGTPVRYHLSKNQIFAVVDDEDYKPAVGYYEMVTGTDGIASYTLTFGATGSDEGEDATNTASTRSVPFIDFTKLICSSKGDSYDKLILDGKCTIDTISMAGSDLTGKPLLENLAYNGASSAFTLKNTYQDGGETKEVSVVIGAFTGLKDRVYFNVNIKSDTFLTVCQKSPNETPTSITVSNIGYDKYKYDVNAKYMLMSDFEGSDNDGIKYMAKGHGGTGYKGDYANFTKDLIASNGDGLVVIVTSNDALKLEDGSPDLLALYMYDQVEGVWTDVTSNYKTKNILITGALKCSATGKQYYSQDELVDSYMNSTIWYISDAKKADSYNHTSYQRKTSGSYELQSDINYNTVTLSCKEEVYPGSYTNGGEWTGSLYEKGVDAAGANIYFPNVIPDNSVTFIEVTPVHTFDELDCLDSNGFFNEGFLGLEKIVDPIGPAIDTYTFTIKGQRYCQYLNDLNVSQGTIGCSWVDGYQAIINDGLVEAQNPCYDDALIFMEPTGQEAFKSKLMVLRTKYHDTSTVISPKIITKAEFNAPATITVAGRSTGTAQYVGEFKMYDAYTGKYWWCQPIGDIGVNLARIMEKKLGGIAPAGTNDSQGLGGVLSRAVLAKKWDFPDSTLEILTNKGLNAITYTPDTGLMLQDHRTTQDPARVTDWSYLGHSMSFDLCKREIRDKVMFDQLHKRVSDYYFSMREKQVQAILNKRITGTDPIWYSASVDITGQNTPSTKAQRKFMILVRVKVNVYSDYVVLTFVNEAQE